MRITGEGLESLQITNKEVIHPNVNFAQSPHSLSLVRIYEHHCKTNGGRELLKSWMQRPLAVEAELEERWNQVDWLLRIEPDVIDRIQSVLSSSTSFKYSKNRNKASVLNGILAGVKAVAMFKHLLNDTLLDREINLDSLNEIQHLIIQIVNLKASKSEGRVVFQRGVSLKLDELYEVFDRLEDILVMLLLYTFSLRLQRRSLIV